MSDRASPLGSDFAPGRSGNLEGGIGVLLSEPQHGFIGELAAFESSIGTVSKLAGAAAAQPGAIAFAIARNRWFLAGLEGMDEQVSAGLKTADGSLIDLSHGRTCLRVSGPKAEWVLSKLYAIDFALAAFRAGTGLSTAHHSIFTQIYRHDEVTFDLFVFRSLARSFWHTLQRAAEEQATRSLDATRVSRTQPVRRRWKPVRNQPGAHLTGAMTLQNRHASWRRSKGNPGTRAPVLEQEMLLRSCLDMLCYCIQAKGFGH